MKKISHKDIKVWKEFINSKKKVLDKDEKIKKDSIYKEKIIDLHGFTLDEANTKIEDFISSCFDKGVTKINIITGKGTRSKNKEDPYQSKDLSILKYSVPNYIEKNKFLMSKISKIDFDAIHDPSNGSFDIILKKND